MGQRISDRFVKSLREDPPERSKVIFDEDTKARGFGIRVSPKAKVAFILDYRLNGRQRRHKIGDYPTWSVEAAREEARRLRRGIDRGHDPEGERQERRSAPTVKDLAERYERDHLPSKRPSSAARDKEMLNAHVLPAIGDRLVAEIHHGDVKALHERVTKNNGPVRANRVLALVSTMFSVSLVPQEGEAEAWRTPVQGNPAKGVKRNHEEARERYFTPEELERVVAALDAYPGRNVANMLKFVMLTGCRPIEAVNATWDQFDLDRGIWTKPSAAVKSNKKTITPLAPPAMELLTTIRADAPEGCDLVFPGRKFASGRAWEQIKQYRFAWEKVRRAAKLEPGPEGHLPRVYDLRHSFATLGVGSGLSLVLIGRLLGHTQQRTTARYAHAADEPLRRAATKITTAMTGGRKKVAGGGNVVAFDRGKGDE